LYNKYQISLEELQEKRDGENLRTFQTAARDIKKIALKSKVFDRFCKILDVINGRKNIPSDWGIERIQIGSCSKDLVAKALEERFGYWLKINEKIINDSEKYLNAYDELEEKIKRDATCGELIKNPYYFVQSGNRYLKNKDYDKAVKQYSNAIRIDKNFAENAYYNRGYARIAWYGESARKHSEKIDEASS
jgi:tetratricopeptide (TPR) repeat protein